MINPNMFDFRCAWADKSPRLSVYHDLVWGPMRYPRSENLFRALILETMQSGLSWETVLIKEKNFDKAFFEFDPVKMSEMTDDYIENVLMQDKGIIRNLSKLKSARTNAKAWLTIEMPDLYLWQLVKGAPLISNFSDPKDIPSETPESRAVAKALKAKGFVHIGPKVAYAFMQAVGLAIDHTTNCHRHPDHPSYKP
ncbi:DNA-3-methyladenine glycosylase I [Pseudomonas helleri]|nr:DNA-3-methyladenine glycosylase I [Pseudomonas helleri]